MKLNQKGLIQWIALIILAIALPAVLYLAQQTQIFKPRANYREPSCVQQCNADQQAYGSCTSACNDPDEDDFRGCIDDCDAQYPDTLAECTNKCPNVCTEQPGHYTQCGGSCNGVTYLSRHTVDVTKSVDASCNVSYQCRDEGVIVGQCGNTVPTPSPTPTPQGGGTPPLPSNVTISLITDFVPGIVGKKTTFRGSVDNPNINTVTITGNGEGFGDANVQCNSSQCTYSLEWTPDPGDEGTWNMVATAKYASGQVAGTVHGIFTVVAATPPGRGTGTPPTATIVVATRSQGGSGNYYSTVYPGFITNLQAQAQSTGSNLKKLRINITDGNVASNIAETDCSGTTCEVLGRSYTWPGLPTGIESKPYFVYVEAETEDRSFCSGRGNPAANSPDCAPGSEFILLPSSHLSFLLQVRPPQGQYRVLLGATSGGPNGSRCVLAGVGEGAIFFTQQECERSSYFRDSNTPVFCSFNGCREPLLNRYDLTRTGACYPNPDQCSRGSDALSGFYDRGGSGPIYSVPTFRCTGPGGTFVPVPEGSTCQLPNYCVSGNPECWRSDCASATPTGNCTSGGSCPVAGQTNPYRVFSGGICIGAPGCGVPQCEYGETRPTPTPAPGYECPVIGGSCTLRLGGGWGTNQSGCDESCRRGTGSPTPTPTTSPGVLPQSVRLSVSSISDADCRYNLNNPIGGGPPNVEVIRLDNTSRVTRLGNTFTINNWNLTGLRAGTNPGQRWVCAQFSPTEGGAGNLGDPFSALIIYQPTSTPTPTPGGCVCQGDNTCSDECSSPSNTNRFDRHPDVTYGDSRQGNRIRCSIDTDEGVQFSATPSQSDKNAYCNRSKRTKGDADGIDNVNSIDLGYWIRGIHGYKIPPNVNPDFDGNGQVSGGDRTLWDRIGRP